jgi:hypothetical protein
MMGGKPVQVPKRNAKSSFIVIMLVVKQALQEDFA